MDQEIIIKNEVNFKQITKYLIILFSKHLIFFFLGGIIFTQIEMITKNEGFIKKNDLSLIFFTSLVISSVFMIKSILDNKYQIITISKLDKDCIKIRFLKYRKIYEVELKEEDIKVELGVNEVILFVSLILKIYYKNKLLCYQCENKMFDYKDIGYMYEKLYTTLKKAKFRLLYEKYRFQFFEYEKR